MFEDLDKDSLLMIACFGILSAVLVLYFFIDGPIEIDWVKLFNIQTYD